MQRELYIHGNRVFNITKVHGQEYKLSTLKTLYSQELPSKTYSLWPIVYSLCIIKSVVSNYI